MRRSPLLAATAVASALLFRPGQVIVAQQMQAPRDTVWWYVSSYQLDWQKVDSLVKLTRAYTLPTATQAKRMGTLLDYRILVHAYGSEYNFQVIRQFRHFADISTDTSFAVAFRRTQPDSTRRSAIEDAFRWAFGDGTHRDEIYHEVRP